MTGRSTPEWVGRTPDSPIPPRVRARVFDRHGGVCAKTGRKIGPGDEWDCDHIIALANGGPNREMNLQPVLCDAHREKTREDVAIKKKNARVRAKHIGTDRFRRKAKIPGSRGTKWKKKIGGEAVPRAD